MSARRTEQFALSDRQWANITKWIALPDEARPRLNEEIVRFREIKATWRSPPSEIKRKLNRIGAAATKLANLLDGLSVQERIELAEAQSHRLGWIIGGSKTDDAIARIREVAATCKTAGEQASRFSKAEQALSFVEWMDAVLRDFAGRQVSQSKVVMAFLCTVYGVANGRKRDGAVSDAVKKLIKARGGKSAKNPSNGSLVRAL
jgi:hypothetical protein